MMAENRQTKVTIPKDGRGSQEWLEVAIGIPIFENMYLTLVNDDQRSGRRYPNTKVNEEATFGGS
jgi:hypothetical protein